MRELAPEQRQAGGAAVALIVSLFLPWYQKNVADQGELISGNLNAFSVFSFVEAAVALVAVAVLALLWARAQRRGFHLPGGDGTVILGGGLWALFLLVWRLFDRPDVTGDAGANVGISWGWFVAVVCAAGLGVAGARLRAANRPEPPNPAADLDWEEPERGPRGTRRARPADHTAVTQVLRERPSWQGDPPPEPPGGVAPRRPTGPRDGGDEPPSQDRLF